MTTFYHCTQSLYQDINRHFPIHQGNLCGSCHLCCTANAQLGVSELEYDFIAGYLASTGRSADEADAFREYITRTVDPEDGNLLYRECPFYDYASQGCSIYAARPLSCRTFGYFINEKYLHMIPGECGLKSSVRVYTDETFPVIMPFVIPFITLCRRYEAQKKGALEQAQDSL